MSDFLIGVIVGIVIGAILIVYNIDEDYSKFKQQKAIIEKLEEELSSTRELNESVKCVNGVLVLIQKKMPFGHDIIILYDQEGNPLNCSN